MKALRFCIHELVVETRDTLRTSERDAWLSGARVLSRNATMPESRREERKRTCRRKVNQKWRGQHEPPRHSRGGRQSASEVTVKRARLSALRAFVEQQLKGFRISGEFGGAIGRARDAAC